ncbi:LPXTG cell wall anchor domain-containing protein [Nocardioides sp.]|nr:LPXTG cell wall anchor domain-containing protein [Nocardioides sp.]
MLGWAPQAQADDYTPEPVPTECTVEVPTSAVGRNVVLEASVSANSNTPITGTVRLSIARGSSDREVWSTTRRYNGSRVRVEGPTLPRGNYTATSQFTSDREVHGDCAGSARFQVRSKSKGGEVAGETEGAGGSNGSGGSGGSVGGVATGLPNTGGPHLLVLLVGLGLVAAGGGILTRTRRTALA